MKSADRRALLLKQLSDCQMPLSGSELAHQFQVSRQVIVNDIALLRAQGQPIISTNKGYLMMQKHTCSRIFKERHDNAHTRAEYELIVDHGGTIKNIFVYHRTYGIVKADLNLSNRFEIDQYLKSYEGSVSSPLENITDGYHYHEVEASSEEVLETIGKALDEAGFLAPLSAYEPVDF